MSGTLSRRLSALEIARKPPRGGVIQMLPGEAPAQAAERAIASGRRGPFLVVPAQQIAEEWEAAAVGLPTFQESCRQEFHAKHGPLRGGKASGR